MELPPDDWGLDLGDAPPLPDEVPDEGQELPGLPDDDIMGDVFGDHLADQEWLERNLADISVEDSSDYYYGALIPGLPADDFGGMDICEVCEAVAAGDIDLPEEVANDELDDLFLDVTTASPKKEDRSLAKKRIGEKRNTFACSWGPPLQISRPT